MFDILARYLFEFKKLTIPAIGVFEMGAKEASADLVASTIAAPSWIVNFTPVGEADHTPTETGLTHWLAANIKLPADEARKELDQFVAGLQQRLNNGEDVNWPQIGILKKADGQIDFTPEAIAISPFTNVTAQKIARENTSHQTLVGDRETTTAHMREQLLLPDEKKNRSSVIMWVVLGAALVAAAWFFSQNGCNTSATGNRQKVETSKSGDTYKIR